MFFNHHPQIFFPCFHAFSCIWISLYRTKRSKNNKKVMKLKDMFSSFTLYLAVSLGSCLYQGMSNSCTYSDFWEKVTALNCMILGLLLHIYKFLLMWITWDFRGTVILVFRIYCLFNVFIWCLENPSKDLAFPFRKSNLVFWHICKRMK